MEAQAALLRSRDIDCDLRNGTSACLLHFPFRVNTDIFRISAITLARTIQTHKGSTQDITQNFISVSLLAMLEPFLGVINCSLPLLRPIGREICGATNARKPQRAISHPRTDFSRRVHRLPGPYSLNTITGEDIGSESHINLCKISNEHGESLLMDPERARVKRSR